ncbi:MAG TPA: TonB-dependent receptor [Patescibacteria group bacterium]|nr:TonB-dependent receptor [Patescibacteria group bacterium]
MKYLIYLLLAFACFSPASAFKNTPDDDKAILNGYVLDSETKETLIGATVTVKGTKFGAFTNKSGYFSIRNIPPGSYTISVSMLGYEKFEENVTLKSGEAKSVRFLLKTTNVITDEVTVEAEREVEKRQIDVSKVNIPIEQLTKMRIGGEADVFRSLQMLPGVLTSSQLSSGLFIRGGSPDQNLVLIDGMTVYNPSHLLGFISAFNSDAIKDVELIKGGFAGEYGGRLSAVLNITQKDGNQKEVAGVASLGAISSRLSLEGPLGNGSWFIGGRRTYLDLLLKLIPEDPENPLPTFNFWDVNAKISQNITENDKMFLSGFGSADNLGLSGPGFDFDIGIGNRAGALRWTHVFGDQAFASVNFSASQYKNGFKGDQSGARFEVVNSITDYTLKTNIEWFTTENLTLKTGLENTKFTFGFLRNFTNEGQPAEGENGGGQTNLTVNDWMHAGYAQMNYQLTDLLSAQASGRVSYIGLADKFMFDPRAAVRYQLQENVAVKAAWGIYHQYLKLASLQDFSFFDTWLPTDSSVNPGRAEHYIVSVETQPFEGYDLNVDGYFKRMFDISEINQFAVEGDDVGDFFYSGDGRAYGAEIFLQKKKGDFTGWFGYALGFVNATFKDINNGEEFRPKYDRRHDLKFVGMYTFGNWELGATFTFQSGQSYTAAGSRFQTFQPGDNMGTGVIIPSQRYGKRLPPSHQLNMNIGYNSTFFGLQARYMADIYNVYSRRDIWFRYYDTSKQDVTEVKDVRLLPILPTISMEVRF